jgi:hypothetical protein
MPSGFTVGSCQVQGGVARLCALSLPSALAGFIAYLFKLDPRHVDTSPDAVELGLVRAELKAFPSHATKVRTGAYPPVDDPGEVDPVHRQISYIPTASARRVV